MALTVKPLEKVRKNIPLQEVINSNINELVRVNIQVDKQTRQLWRTEAIKRGISLKELIQQAMEAYI